MVKGLLERERLISILNGAVAGVLGGLMGVGGAAILVPVMVGLMGIPQHKAHGTSLAIVVPLAFAGFLLYLSQGYTDWGLIVLLATTSSLGAMLGARVMLRMSEVWLRRAFSLFLVGLGLRLLLGGV